MLVGIKCSLALLSGSVALIADAIHSASDVISSATVFAGIRIPKRKSKNFPYGLYKVETLFLWSLPSWSSLQATSLSTPSSSNPCSSRLNICPMPWRVYSWPWPSHLPFPDEEKGKGIKVSEWLIEKGVDTVYSPKEFKGKGPAYVFSDAGIDVVVTTDTNLEDIQRSFQKERNGEAHFD